eukprot:TRINITY_DN20515_c0_g2_i1.p1 TRINITY_DN20515_c0_g2~~TRINITY_DN20515_c0_g2_i1.p1  ORF type:complete len:1541 (+),score=308.33 TRINITY_DN20515_c0_g2_i1:84-4706(+)
MRGILFSACLAVGGVSALAAPVVPWSGPSGWTELAVNAADGPRFAPEACVAALGTVVVAFGGNDADTGKAGTAALRLFRLETGKWETHTVSGPPARYNCQLAADEIAGAIYLFSGKRKVEVNGEEEKTEYSDFWRLDLGAMQWAELPSAAGGAENAPPPEGMNGALAVVGRHVVLAGSDDAAFSKAWRFSIADGKWAAPLDNIRFALGKPLLVSLPGEFGLLIGGADAGGSPANAKGTLLSLASSPPAVTEAGFTGTAPSGEAVTGGVAADGSRVFAYAAKPDGTMGVYSLDLHSGAWAELPAGSGPVARVDVGAVAAGGALVVFAGEGAADEELRGDVWAYRPAAAATAPAWLSSVLKWSHFIENPSGDADKVMRFAVEGCSAAVGPRIVVFGGNDDENGKAGSSLVRVLDVTTAKWTTHKPAAGWPPPRYNCKMAGDPASGTVYLLGGKRKVEVNGEEEKTEYTDFWSLDVGSTTWTELPSLSSKARAATALADPNAPKDIAMDGAMAVAGGAVIVAGSDEGGDTRTYRFSLASGAWLQPLEDSRLVMGKPLLVAVGATVLLIGGESALGEPTNAGGLRLDLSAEPPAWDVAGFTGDAPSGPGLSGGAAADGSVVFVFAAETDGTNSLRTLDVASGAWQKQTVSGPPARVDAGASVVDDVLVVYGGEANDEKLLGDAWVYNPSGRDTAPTAPAGDVWKLTQELLDGSHKAYYAGWAEYEEQHTEPWTKVAENDAAGRLGASMTRVGSKVYIYGGEDRSPLANKLGTDILMELDLDTLTFRHFPRTEHWPHPASVPYVTSDPERRKIYVFGGKSTALTDLQRTALWEFDIATETWRQLYAPESDQNDPCARGEPKNPEAPRPGTASDSSLLSVRDHVIVLGSDKAASDFAFAFDKRTETWKRHEIGQPGHIEDATVMPAFDDDTCCGVWTAGQDRTGGIGRAIMMVNFTVEPWEFNDLAAEEDAIPGEGYKAGPASGGFFLMGEPAGRGALAGHGGIARFFYEQRKYTVVNTSSGCEKVPASTPCMETEDWWQVPGEDFSMVTYKDKVIVFGGVVDVDGVNVRSGGVWVYDNSLCPANCNDRGTCVHGVCEDCMGHRGIACEIPIPTVSTNLVWLWVMIGVLVVVLFAVPPALYKYYMQWKKNQRLFSAHSMAQKCAESIARMDFDSVAYIEEIAKPTPLQQAFKDIIKMLRMYRGFMPQALLVQDDEPDAFHPATLESISTLRRRSQRNPLAGASFDAGARRSVVSVESSMASSVEAATRGATGGGYQQRLQTLQDRMTGTLQAKRCTVLLAGINNVLAGFARAVNGETTIDDVGMSLNSIIEIIVAEAAKHRGVLDQMSGDRQIFSFGVMSGAAGQRLAAARAALGIAQIHKKDASDGGHIGIDSGHAHVGNVGAGSARKHGVVGLVVNSAYAAARAARYYGVAIAVGHNIADETNVDLQYRALVAWFAEKMKGGMCVMYELLHEKDQQENDEWMYQMESSMQSDPYADINQRMRSAAKKAVKSATTQVAVESLEDRVAALEAGGSLCSTVPIAVFF